MAHPAFTRGRSRDTARTRYSQLFMAHIHKQREHCCGNVAGTQSHPITPTRVLNVAQHLRYIFRSPPQAFLHGNRCATLTTMLAKRTLIPTVFAGAIVTALGGCSLQDYDYLGADNGKKDDTTGEETTAEDTTESETSSNSPDASVTSDTSSSAVSSSDTSITIETVSSHEPDASVSSESSMPVEAGLSSSSSSSAAPASSSSSEPASSSSDVPTEDPPLPVVVDPYNLILGASFENGPGDWVVLGNATLKVTTDKSRSGEKSMATVGRTHDWEGPSLEMLDILTPGESYIASAWVRPKSDKGATFHIVRKAICVDDAGVAETEQAEIYLQLGSTYTEGPWAQIVTPPFSMPNCDLQTFVLYVEGPPPGESFYMDDVSVVRAQ